MKELKFVTVEVGVLLLDSILLVLQGPLHLEGVRLGTFDPLEVLPGRPLFEVGVRGPLVLCLTLCPTCCHRPALSPYSPEVISIDVKVIWYTLLLTFCASYEQI